MKKFASFMLTLLAVSAAIGQNNLNDKKLYYDTYDSIAVVDKQYGINRYQPLNMMLGGDTVRNDRNGYAANGYLEDYYTTGELLHKGYYVDGQLKVYKNYYPSGQVERNFRMVDLKKSKLDIFYSDGLPKSKIVYVGNEALKWEDYYPDGTLEFIEEYDKNFQYYVAKSNYYENGTPENTLVLEHKKKLLYTQTYYHINGQIKELGQMIYDKTMFDYKRIGTWKKFDETGKAIKQIKYASGKVQSEKDL